jgi:uncharacterized membrane protein
MECDAPQTKRHLICYRLHVFYNAGYDTIYIYIQVYMFMIISRLFFQREKIWEMRKAVGLDMSLLYMGFIQGLSTVH